MIFTGVAALTSGTLIAQTSRAMREIHVFMSFVLE
jgi:hypothetical protein